MIAPSRTVSVLGVERPSIYGEVPSALLAKRVLSLVREVGLEQATALAHVNREALLKICIRMPVTKKVLARAESWAATKELQ